YTEAIIHLREAIEIGNELNTLSSNQQRHGILARASWFSGDISNAITAIRQAREYNTPFYNHIVVATQGCIMLCTGKKSEAQTAFNEALEFANDLLNTAPMQYDA
ncbi:MAG TPA: hypothetical protein PLZ51_24720, partial [Aggregatilineales bacterium]|nr:hypothetical protein [Aggregatilineales bacterium]